MKILHIINIFLYLINQLLILRILKIIGIDAMAKGVLIGIIAL